MTAGLAIQATTNLRRLPIAPWAGLGVLAAWAAAEPARRRAAAAPPRRMNTQLILHMRRTSASSPDRLRAPDCRFVSRLGRSRSDRSSQIGVRRAWCFVKVVMAVWPPAGR